MDTINQITESIANLAGSGSGSGKAVKQQDSEEDLPKALELTFDASTNEINLTLFEHVDERAVPLELKFTYSPETPWCPIAKQESSSENRACKEAYWKLWELDTPDSKTGKKAAIDDLQLDAVFQGEEVEIKQEEISRFCNVVGNAQEAYKGAGEVPMDFSIKLAWRSIMRSIFPNEIDGNLLKLVHLSNGFTQLKGAPTLHVGDRVTSTSRIVSVTNSDSGKTVAVKGTVFLLGTSADGQPTKTPVIQAESSFLYRGSFSDFQNTFDKKTETTYSLTPATPQAVAVLQSKEWFDWLDDSKPLQPGTTLIFSTESEYRYRAKDTYAAVNVSGMASLASTIGPLKGVKDVAEVNYSSAGSTKGNPVLEYLKRHGTPLDQPVMLASPYTITSAERPSTIYTPASNWAYSTISGDVNPIHVNPYFSDLANLPGTITHGMWTSAATRKYVEQVAAENKPERVVAYNVAFTAMVLPNSELSVVLKHVGQKDGNKLIDVATYDAAGTKVVSGMAEVSQAPTAYVFTGQGSQEPGMGMELYASSEVARKVWDRADEHLGDVYGFSIIDIVKHNPQEITVHFGGLKGQRIRQRYMDMTYVTSDKSGNVKTLPLFPDIDLRTSRYTFSSPTGLLFATQFAQIALVVTEKAAFEDMRAKGLVQEGAPFAGHSLGEYSALASIAEVLPISALVDVVFYRGITMQRAVERDSLNRSNYAMVAINPSRIGKTFTDAALREVVDTVSTRTDTLLQIVNYNVDGQQYVAAGELVALQALSNVLNFLKVQKIDLKKLTESMPVEQVREQLGEIVDECFSQAKELDAKSGGHIKLERGFATIPLPGIDVPFHSRYLWAGVMPFRTYLSKKINPADLNPDLLVGRYIPNLTAQPFEITKAYCELVHNQTSSPRLDKVLKKWEEDAWEGDENRTKLGYIILVELLAYQFASPVRWIETQDKLFVHYKFERLIELGPGPTLTGMAQRTLKAKYQTGDDSTTVKREIFCVAKNQADIYYIREDEAVEAPAPAASAPAPAAAAPAAAAPAPVATAPAPAPAASAGPAAAVPDEPLKAVDTLRVIIAQKLKKQIGEISLQKNIKDMVGGKSTLQNEILGDLQAEFSSAPEKGEELPLEELGAALNVGYSGALGKHTNGLISRMVGSKLPGGFGISAVKAYLGKKWGLGPGRTDGALLVALTMEPAKRLGSEGDAQAFLDSVAQAYAKQAGVDLSSGPSAGGGGGGGGGAVVDSEALNKLQAQQDEFVSQQVDVLLRYLKRDGREGFRLADATKIDAEGLQAQLDAISREHGEAYIQGIQPVFESLKARHFNSSFNWVRQDALSMFFDIIFGRLTTVDRDVTHRCLIIMNRADPALIDYMTYVLGKVDASRGPNYKLAKEFGAQLLENCKEVVGTAPLYKDVTFPTAPKTTITAKGDIVYEETNRKGVSRLEKYVAEMAAGSSAQPTVNLDKVHESISNLYKLVKSQPAVNKQHMAAIKSLYGEVVKNMGKKAGPSTGSGAASAQGRSPARARRPSNQFLRPVNVAEPTPVPEDATPLLHLKRKVGNDWQYSSKLTSLYLDILKEIATSGTTFEHKNALLTGVGKASIGVEIVKGLLSGGARVVITTSRYSRATVEYYQGIYQECGSRGSSLTVVPFNGGSKQDIDALVEYIYSTDPNNGLDMDLDFILPFAAIPENGREIDGIDDKSELAHRVMLTNLLRLLGAVKTKKASRRFITRPTQVILPLSPNHGLFGNDGLYSESKISLETLFNRWNSESWGQYLCIAGAVIGWTRGTGLMSATNVVAAGVEELGCRTFSAKEMAFNILGLMHPLMFDVSQTEPVWADFNGGMSAIADLHILNARIRDDINKTASTRKAISMDNSADFKVTNGNEAESVQQKVNIAPRANFTLPFPKLPETNTSKPDLNQLQGLIDLEKVVVVTGYAEVGPFGSSRTRWQMEATGSFTIEGLLELAFTLGLIRHFNGRLKSGQTYVGWVDAKSEEPVDDKDVRGRYEKYILEHTGVRLIEPELFRGYDPKRKGFTQEIEIQHDLEPIETNPADAERFKLEHGNKVDLWVDGDRCFIKFKKGAKLLVPKAVRFDRLVAGQIPTGWDARVFGIPDDIVSQTDRTALWALVCVAEALMASGITDPYELYKYVHPSEVGTAIGSGMGGMESLSKMFRDRREEKDVQNDILQETFINTVAGWVNLLLVSSNGPVKIPVGACATALQSLEISCDTILSGKAKVMFAGGFDDFSEEGSYEFANMKATSNTETEFASGREPNEMSRPTTSTRAGFMESQGCGVQVLMSAKTALEMGATIYGVVGYTATATDKAGRSIPAPGRGVLSTARQLSSKYPSRTLDVSYRKRQLEFRRKQISEWLDNEITMLKEETTDQDAEYHADRLEIIQREARRQESEAQATFGMLSSGDGFDASVAPLRRALAVWGLTIDDIGVASFHGTSTKANDKNESNAFNTQFMHLGRTKGNACPVVAQKWLTGHPKGGAAAWMMNGMIQTIQAALVPGNRNADNISPEMRDFEYLVYPSRSIQTDGIKAGLLKSFGFGQVGGEALVIHPEYLLATLDASKYASYRERNNARLGLAYRKYNDMFVQRNLVILKEAPPYTPELEQAVLLNPRARASKDAKGSYSFTKDMPAGTIGAHALAAATMAATTAGVYGVGTDVELFSAIPIENATFLERNFTSAELDYCNKAADMQASLAGRWAAKEAVFKSLKTSSKGGGASMKDIEIVSSDKGPTVQLHGDAQRVASEMGIKVIDVSLSHADGVALAVAVAKN